MSPPSDRPTVNRLPVPPSGASYGRLLTELLRIHGARPPNTSRAGERWTFKELSDAVGFKDREAQQIRRFAKDRELPTPERHALIEAALFGTDSTYCAPWRAALRVALEAGTAANHTVTMVTEARQTQGSSHSSDCLAHDPPVHLIPVRLPLHAIALEQPLTNLRSLLCRQPHRAAICGPNGVGKTVLAASYVRQFGAHYSAVAWINADHPDRCMASLARFGESQKWVVPETQIELAAAVTRARLGAAGNGVLVVFDAAADVSSIYDFLPDASAAHVLITSNSPNWHAEARPIILDCWTPEEGAAFFRKRLGLINDWEVSKELSAYLGGLPIALEIAAAYCEQRKVSLSQCRRGLANTLARHLSDPLLNAPGYPRTIAAAIQTSMRAATERNSAAAKLLSLLTQLAPEPIPLELIDTAELTCRIDNDEVCEAEPVREALAALRCFSLVTDATISIKFNGNTSLEALSVHSLIRHVTNESDSTCQKTIIHEAINVLEACYPRDIQFGHDDWMSCTKFAAHVEHLDRCAVARGIESAPLARLRLRHAMHLMLSGQSRPALALLQRALYSSRRSGSDELAEILLQLGLANVLLGRTGRAVRLVEVALNLAKRNPADHHQIAPCYLSLAKIAALEDVEQALTYAQNGLEAANTFLAPKSLEHASAMAASAEFLVNSKPSEALLRVNSALDVLEHITPKPLLSIARATVTKARVLQTMGRFEESRALLGQALSWRQQVYPIQHPGVAVLTIEYASALLKSNPTSIEVESMITEALPSLQSLPSHLTQGYLALAFSFQARGLFKQALHYAQAAADTARAVGPVYGAVELLARDLIMSIAHSHVLESHSINAIASRDESE